MPFSSPRDLLLLPRSPFSKLEFTIKYWIRVYKNHLNLFHLFTDLIFCYLIFLYNINLLLKGISNSRYHGVILIEAVCYAITPPPPHTHTHTQFKIILVRDKF